MKKLIITILLLSIGSVIMGQDIITKKDGTTLKVIIKEVNKNTIHYVEFDDPNQVAFSIDKALISNVEFKYGKKLEVENPADNTLYFIDDKINNVMFNFSAFGGNTLGLSYERAIKPGQSFIGEIKAYGLGVSNKRRETSGFGADIGYRFRKKSHSKKGKYRPDHLLEGAYFSPILGFSTGKTDYINRDSYFDAYEYTENSSTTYSHSILHFGLQYGMQWIIQNKLSIDSSIGFHYYTGSNERENADRNFFETKTLHLGNMVGNDNKLFSFNLRIGFLMGKKSIIKKSKDIF